MQTAQSMMMRTQNADTESRQDITESEAVTKYTRQKHKAPEEKHSLQHKVQKGTTKYKHGNIDQETTWDRKTDTEKD